MFLRASERNGDRPAPGVLVVMKDRRRSFFPGGDERCGLILARMQVGEVLDDPETRIEFGLRYGAAWETLNVLKKSVLDGNDPHKFERPVL